MPNVRLVVEYDGSRFSGWQAQKGHRTIQEELEKAIATVLRLPSVRITASGRTDAGVHAMAQVISFHLDQEPDYGVLRRGVSSILRGEVSVILAEPTSDDFHARYSAKSKHYRYTILNRDTPPVLDWGKVWFIHDNLDVERMTKEGAKLEGKHDYKSFQGSGCVAKSTIKEIFSSRVSYNPPYIYYDVIGSGFLKQMVRNIVGTLVRYGRGGEMGAGSISQLLEARDRRLAGPTAPACGLCLVEVHY